MGPNCYRIVFFRRHILRRTFGKTDQQTHKFLLREMLSAEEQYNYFGEAPFTGSLYKVTCNHDGSLLYVGQAIKPGRREKEHHKTGMLGPYREFTVFHTIQSNSMLTVLEAMDAMEERIVAGEDPPLNVAVGGGQVSATIKQAKRSYTRWLEVYAKLVDYKKTNNFKLSKL